MANKIVVHFSDKRIKKGFTYDFAPEKDIIHVTVSDEKGEKSIIEVNLNSLKAIFFVKDFKGNKNYTEKKTTEFRVIGAKKIKAVFNDGETMLGSTVSYNPSKKGLFITPSDPNSNNVRVYVPFKALKSVEIIT